MILFLYGADSFRSRLRVLEYKERFQKKYGNRGLIITINCEEEQSLNFSEIITAQGFFWSTKLIIIKNLISQFPPNKQKELKELLDTQKNIFTSKEIIIIFWEESEPLKTNILFRFFLKNSKNEVFKELKGLELNKWIATRIKEIEPLATISRSAIEKLILYTEGNLESINNELHKLTNYTKKVDETEIDKLVSVKFSSDIFEVIENASGGNKKRALELFHQQLQNKRDPFYLLSMYAYQFRNLLKIAEYYQKGIIDKFYLSQKTSLHPYVIQKSLPQLQKLDLDKIKTLFLKIQKIDMEAKTGKSDIVLALDKFLVEL